MIFFNGFELFFDVLGLIADNIAANVGIEHIEH
jgi:hypothetical protein